MPNPITMGRAFAGGVRSTLARAAWVGHPSPSLHFLPRRGFQSLPRLNEKEFPRVFFELDAKRGAALLRNSEAREFLQGQGLSNAHVSPNRLAWLAAVNTIASSPERNDLSPVGALALVTQLIDVAAHHFPELIAAPAFVSLVSNLEPLDRLVLSEARQASLVEFSGAAVQVAADFFTSTGEAFFDLPGKERVTKLQHFVGRLVDVACELDLGLHPDDADQFIVAATGDCSYGGRFDVLSDSQGWPDMARISVGGPTGLFSVRREDWAGKQGWGASLGARDHLNSEYVMVMEVPTHEVWHACQNSLVDRSRFARHRAFSSDDQYHESLATLLSSCISGYASKAGAFTQADGVGRVLWLPLEEQPAWFLSWMTRERIARSRFFDTDVRRVASMTHLQERDALARLAGIRPRGEVEVEKGPVAGHFHIVTQPLRPLMPEEDEALDERAEAFRFLLRPAE